MSYLFPLDARYSGDSLLSIFVLHAVAKLILTADGAVGDVRCTAELFRMNASTFRSSLYSGYRCKGTCMYVFCVV